MACHQHRCCPRRPSRSGASAAPAAPADYVLLGAADGDVIADAATHLHRAGVTCDRNDLGLRIDCRGGGWRAALLALSDDLAPAARRGLRVVVVPFAASALAFQRALLTAPTLEAFAARAGGPPRAAATLGARDRHLLGDVFRGESLE